MRLGLLAMSGVRAHNAELNALGLTLPGFVERSRVIASLPSLGLLTLAGATPNDVEIEYVEVPDVLPSPWMPGEFDAVAISSFSAQIKEAYELADRYRAAGTKVILGGLHVSAMPHEATAHANAVVLGEGEPLWPQVVEDLKDDNLQTVYDARGIAFDLSEAPMPRYELLEVEKYNRLTVQTQRGCPFDCEFCAASIRISPKFKVKPVPMVIDEIRRIKSIWRQPFIEFADDNTFANKAHGRELLKALAGEQVRWFTETDVSIASDDELLSLMQDSGCAQVLIGFEAPTRAPLEGVEQKANWKAQQFEKYSEAIERIQSHGISVNGCFILGLDGAGPELFEDVLRFVRESGLYEVQVTVQTAFPGTPLYARLQREGRILRNDAWELCTLFDVNFQPSQMTVRELEQGLRNVARALYDADATSERQRAFRERLRELHRRRQ
ncbi:MAG: B12-binding domain-containing radical SAM protein [Acidobacteria bacterium]|nr:MAG: B12-binding domain-containing radical SAM protein [Acidobacteriota bacterium]